MGLAISVGSLADLLIHDSQGADWIRQELADINRILREKQLPEHLEPESFPPEALDEKNTVGGFPYSYLHYLRRVAAYHFQDSNWIATAFPEEDPPNEDAVLEDQMLMFESNLLCHSDTNGYYFPIDFQQDQVLYDDQFPGGFLGSSQRLLAELIKIAPALKIKLEANDTISEAELARVNTESAPVENPLRIEKIVWARLFVCATLSIKHRTAIRFS
jgi:hypothetical protein